eukprot:11177467-Lingulodinium_polyedra.AAC.1
MAAEVAVFSPAERMVEEFASKPRRSKLKITAADGQAEEHRGQLSALMYRRLTRREVSEGCCCIVSKLGSRLQSTAQIRQGNRAAGCRAPLRSVK